jgi:hypothetical protein
VCNSAGIPVGNNTPIKGTIETVPHLPDYVVIYRIASSKFYWIRVWTQNKRYVIRSSKTTYKKEAFVAARQLYIDSITNNLTVAKTNPKSMVAVAESLLAQEKAGSKLSLFNKDRNMLRNAILPHFGTKLLTDVTHADLTEYLGKLNAILGKGYDELQIDSVIDEAKKLLHVLENYPNSKATLNMGTEKLYLLLDVPSEERETFIESKHVVNDTEKTVNEMTTRELNMTKFICIV